MAILKSTNSRLTSQLKSPYAADRVPKSILCVLYGINKPNTTPLLGHISFSPNNKPDQITSLKISTTSLLGANLLGLFQFTTEGSISIYEKAHADNFVTFKISNPLFINDSNIIEYVVESSLTANMVSIFRENSQVCIDLVPSPTSEAVSNIDGGYY